jgi:hypothetical protein
MAPPFVLGSNERLEKTRASGSCRTLEDALPRKLLVGIGERKGKKMESQRFTCWNTTLATF